MGKKLTALSQEYHHIDANREDILAKWMDRQEIDEVLGGLNLSREVFKEDFAIFMFDFFLNVASNKDEPGDCPTLRNLIAFFQTKKISAKDLFLICTGLKDSLIDFYLTDTAILAKTADDPHLCHTLFVETASILNSNFSNILYEYTSNLFKKQDELNQYSRMIEEHVIVTRTDEYGRINYVSDSFCDISEYSRGELMGKPHNIVRHPDMPAEIFKDMWETIQAGRIWEGKIKNSTKHHGYFVANTTVMPVFNDAGVIEGYVSIRHDITDKINANVDTLTKAYNRRRFEQDFGRFYLKALSEGRQLSLIVLDVDDFKLINDTHGHLKGDEVLVGIADVIRKRIRTNDVFARWGGEEFVILMAGAALNVAVAKAEAIREAIARMAFKDIETVSCSFGVAQLQRRESREDFMKRTDDFLYKAKREGKNRVVFS
jgi:diguanylate cyclase (GGDEF)-like protein/PAS domain S-box-containing protein